MGIDPGKTICASFSARHYFCARADSIQKRGYRGAHERLRVIQLERVTVEELVFAWSPRSEIWHKESL